MRSKQKLVMVNEQIHVVVYEISDEIKGKSLVDLRKMLISNALAEQLGKRPEELVINRTDKGKPYLQGQELWHNLSHSGEYLALATSSMYEVGIDIQKNIRNLKRFPYMVLSDNERLLSDGMDEAKRARFLQRIWTCKEAIVKAVGDGLTIDVSKIDLADRMWPKSFYRGRLRYEGDRELILGISSVEFPQYSISYAIIYDKALPPDVR